MAITKRRPTPEDESIAVLRSRKVYICEAATRALL